MGFVGGTVLCPFFRGVATWALIVHMLLHKLKDKSKEGASETNIFCKNLSLGGLGFSGNFFGTFVQFFFGVFWFGSSFFSCCC